MALEEAVKFAVGMDTSAVKAGMVKINRMGGQVATKMATGFAAAGAAAVAATAVMAKGFIAVGAEVETAKGRLTTLTGSAEIAEQRLRDLYQLGSKTPFELGGLVEMETTLEAFGAHAPDWRDQVMDLAAAMNLDLAEAANAVGRAYSGGAGAADILRERGVLAMVETQKGIKATEMSLKDFRQALHDTLSAEGIGGATARLATTFSGLVSNLQDEWTKFQKQVADAGAFDAVKAAAAGTLDLMQQNEEAVSRIAKGISGGFVRGLLVAVDAAQALHYAWREGERALIAIKGTAAGVGVIVSEKLILPWMEGLREIALAVGDSERAGKMGLAIMAQEQAVRGWRMEVNATTVELKAHQHQTDELMHGYTKLSDSIQAAADKASEVRDTPMVADEAPIPGVASSGELADGRDQMQEHYDLLAKMAAEAAERAAAEARAEAKRMEAIYRDLSGAVTSHYAGMAEAVIGEQMSMGDAVRNASLGLFSDLLMQLSAFMATKAAVAFAAGNFVAAGMYTTASGLAAAGAGAIAATNSNMNHAAAEGGEVFHSGGMARSGGATVLQDEVAVLNRRAADEQGLDEISTRHMNEGMGGDSRPLVIQLGREMYRFEEDRGLLSRATNGSGVRTARAQNMSASRAGWAG